MTCYAHINYFDCMSGYCFKIAQNKDITVSVTTLFHYLVKKKCSLLGVHVVDMNRDFLETARIIFCFDYSQS